MARTRSSTLPSMVTVLGALVGGQLFELVDVFTDDRNAAAVDDPARNGGSYHATHDHAKGGRGDGSRCRAFGAQRLGFRAKGCGGTEAAFERGGTGHQADQRVETKQARHTDANPILHQGQQPAGHQIDTKGLAALLEHRQAAAQADGGEKGNHQRALHGGVELEGDQPQVTQQPGQQGKAEAADDRCRYTEVLQPMEAPLESRANSEQQQGECRGGHGIQGKVHSGAPKVLCHEWQAGG